MKKYWLTSTGEKNKNSMNSEVFIRIPIESLK